MRTKKLLLLLILFLSLANTWGEGPGYDKYTIAKGLYSDGQYEKALGTVKEAISIKERPVYLFLCAAILFKLQRYAQSKEVAFYLLKNQDLSQGEKELTRSLVEKNNTVLYAVEQAGDPLSGEGLPGDDLDAELPGDDLDDELPGDDLDDPFIEEPLDEPSPVETPESAGTAPLGLEDSLFAPELKSGEDTAEYAASNTAPEEEDGYRVSRADQRRFGESGALERGVELIFCGGLQYNHSFTLMAAINEITDPALKKIALLAFIKDSLRVTEILGIRFQLRRKLGLLLEIGSHHINDENDKIIHYDLSCWFGPIFGEKAFFNFYGGVYMLDPHFLGIQGTSSSDKLEPRFGGGIRLGISGKKFLFLALQANITYGDYYTMPGQTVLNSALVLGIRIAPGKRTSGSGE